MSLTELTGRSTLYSLRIQPPFVAPCHSGCLLSRANAPCSWERWPAAVLTGHTLYSFELNGHPQGLSLCEEREKRIPKRSVMIYNIGGL